MEIPTPDKLLEFPSPCGGKLQYDSYPVITHFKMEFPSPYGDKLLKSWVRLKLDNFRPLTGISCNVKLSIRGVKVDIMFPSPYGDKL